MNWSQGGRRLACVVVLMTIGGMPRAPYAQAQPPQSQSVKPDVIWKPTDDDVVAAMIAMAKVTKDDVVYDLGCGDGKILIAAARQIGARGVGVEIDPDMVAKARAAVAAAGVGDKVTIIQGNIFDAAIKIGDASVVMLYLLESLNVRLMPRLKSELKPGTRVVSNAFHMGLTWPAEKSRDVGNSTIYLWTIR